MEFSIIRLIIFAIILIASFIALYINLKRVLSYLSIAQPEDRTNEPIKRVLHTIKIAFAQTKIMRDFRAGIIHVAIFWGFLVLLFSASEAIFQGFYPSFNWSFLGPIYTIITFTTDIVCPLIVLAILISLVRRFIIKVPRLQGDTDEAKDALLVLAFIFIIVTSLILENAIASQAHQIEWAYKPFSEFIASVLGLSPTVCSYEFFWWSHIIFILLFMNYLPFSKHFHVYTSVPNVYLSSLEPVNKLPRIDFEKEGVEKYGVVDIEDLSWKSLLDSYTCTHCGRCSSVCPANSTGKELSPREIMVNIRQRTFDKAPILLKQKEATNPDETNKGIKLSDKEQEILDKKFIGDYESVEALWQCTTCGACMQECPVMNEHVPAIVGMRRSLVMMESNFPTLLQSAFSNLENNSSPWAFSQMERADWAEGLNIKTVADNPDFDILFWVGCAGSFDDRAKKISIAFAKLMQLAGINFSILGTEEFCNGDVARRAGNEYLADMLVKMNIETLNRYNVKKIVTICPHCFNTFKNEYPDFGAKYEVIHHTEFLLDLINSGKLKIKNKSNLEYTYHDSCYLGRYNNIYQPARDIIHAVSGKSVIEAKRRKDKAFCCGAGGAQMFMEETVGKRINIERTEELLDTGSKCIALNCPFCMTMITDGIKAKEKVDEIAVKDIAEILLESIE